MKNKNATTITPEGVETNVTPKNGKDFSLEECQAIVGGYIETVRASDGRIMIVNEEGKMKGFAPNVKASMLFPHDMIVGTVLLCPDSMFK